MKIMKKYQNVNICDICKKSYKRRIVKILQNHDKISKYSDESILFIKIMRINEILLSEFCNFGRFHIYTNFADIMILMGFNILSFF